MEKINFFGGDNLTSDEDLPWVKDWAKAVKEPGESQEVFTAKVCDKGLYVETGVYKCFIYKKQAVYGFLLEALEVWSKEKLPVKPIVVCSDVKGKAHYGVHEEKPEVVWNKNEELYYSRRANDGKPEIGRLMNPFLQSNSPTQPKKDPANVKAKASTKSQPEASTEGNSPD